MNVDNWFAFFTQCDRCCLLMRAATMHACHHSSLSHFLSSFSLAFSPLSLFHFRSSSSIVRGQQAVGNSGRRCREQIGECADSPPPTSGAVAAYGSVAPDLATGGGGGSGRRVHGSAIPALGGDPRTREWRQAVAAATGGAAASDLWWWWPGRRRNGMEGVWAPVAGGD